MKVQSSVNSPLMPAPNRRGTLNDTVQERPDNALPKDEDPCCDNATQDCVGPDNATQPQGRDAPITARDQGQDRRADGSSTRPSQSSTASEQERPDAARSSEGTFKTGNGPSDEQEGYEEQFAVPDVAPHGATPDSGVSQSPTGLNPEKAEDQHSPTTKTAAKRKSKKKKKKLRAPESADEKLPRRGCKNAGRHVSSDSSIESPKRMSMLGHLPRIMQLTAAPERTETPSPEENAIPKALEDAIIRLMKSTTMRTTNVPARSGPTPTARTTPPTTTLQEPAEVAMESVSS
ncbi:unnamed protein product [Phytophthora fragariaefolia]|uniref:Unnamed protein product n=1 Tax=Phytophthora fragariaefolia TaxID=1490495 RepID=A0A9W6WZT1_9STRA|nr:unnamed protein product [Phytophthora fragariaefolia]